MTSAVTCPVCGFEWGAIAASDIPLRVKSATDAFDDVIESAGVKASERPNPERWSVLEYGAHLRDVLISIRERVITASIEDEPTGSPLHRDERVDLGFYRRDTPSDIRDELSAVSRLFVRTFQSLPPGFETREFVYSPVTPAKVTILWAGAQALHECEHHLGDVRENLALF